jgi:hypothetical protein
MPSVSDSYTDAHPKFDIHTPYPYSISILHIHTPYPYSISILHIHTPYSYHTTYISTLHIPTTYPYYICNACYICGPHDICSEYLQFMLNPASNNTGRYSTLEPFVAKVELGSSRLIKYISNTLASLKIQCRNLSDPERLC